MDNFQRAKEAIEAEARSLSHYREHRIKELLKAMSNSYEHRGDMVIALEERLEGENKDLRKLVDLQTKLLVAYRTGGRPAGYVLDGIPKLKEKLKITK